MADAPQSVPDPVRLSELEERLAELTSRVDGLTGQVAELTRLIQAGSVAGRLPGETGMPGAGPPGDPLIEDEISPGMINVISLIQQGESDLAQQELYSLPEDELSSQPAAVALVAAALFVQRGDYDAGFKALQQVRQLTNDPRLLALMSRLEEQVKR